MTRVHASGWSDSPGAATLREVAEALVNITPWIVTGKCSQLRRRTLRKLPITKKNVSNTIRRRNENFLQKTRRARTFRAMPTTISYFNYYYALLAHAGLTFGVFTVIPTATYFISSIQIANTKKWHYPLLKDRLINNYRRKRLFTLIMTKNGQKKLKRGRCFFWLTNNDYTYFSSTRLKIM